MTADDVIRLLATPAAPGRGRVLPRDVPRCRDAPGVGTAGARAARSVSTAIYYLLKPGHVSELHVLPGDEVFHFYLGGPVRMLQLWPDGTGKEVVLGPDIAAGQVPQLVVPGGVWQGTRLRRR